MAISEISQNCCGFMTPKALQVAGGIDLAIGIALLTIGLLAKYHVFSMSPEGTYALLGTGACYLGISALPYLAKAYRYFCNPNLYLVLDRMHK